MKESFNQLLAYNTLIVLAGVGLLGGVAGVLGTYMVLRRRALIGDALAHASLPGIFLAFALTGSRAFGVLLAGAFVFALLGSWLVSAIRRHTRVKEDAALGVVLSVFFGLGIVLLGWIQNNPSMGGSKAGLNSFFYGKPAGMVAQDVFGLMLAGGFALLVVAVLYKEFKLLSFDSAFGHVQGWPVLRLDMAMMGLVCLVTVIGLPAVGVVMMAGMLIIPAASARFWTDRLGPMLGLAALFGVLTGTIGTLASAQWPMMPAGPIIILAGTGWFVVSLLAAPRKGLIARAWVLVRQRQRTAGQNLLRTLYELNEGKEGAIRAEELLTQRAWTIGRARRLLAEAEARGHVARLGELYALTPEGMREAAEVVRTHRLWEIFLIEEAHTAPSMVDHEAERIEHVLPKDLVDRLERRLDELGLLPKPEGAVPPSPHAIPAEGGGR